MKFYKVKINNGSTEGSEFYFEEKENAFKFCVFILNETITGRAELDFDCDWPDDKENARWWDPLTGETVAEYGPVHSHSSFLVVKKQINIKNSKP